MYKTTKSFEIGSFKVEYIKTDDLETMFINGEPYQLEDFTKLMLWLVNEVGIKTYANQHTNGKVVAKKDTANGIIASFETRRVTLPEGGFRAIPASEEAVLPGIPSTSDGATQVVDLALEKHLSVA